MKINHFISSLRNSDEFISTIFSQGSCYKFAILLKRMYGGEIVINNEKDHAALLIDGEYYDIGNGIDGILDRYTIPTKDEIEMMRSWSFAKNYLLSVGECEFCEEQIIVK